MIQPKVLLAAAVFEAEDGEMGKAAMHFVFVLLEFFVLFCRLSTTTSIIVNTSN